MIDDSARRWLLALSAPMVAINAGPGAAYDCDKFYPFDTSVDLSESWGIDSREQLFEMILRMIDNGHAEDLAHYFRLWHRLSLTEWQNYAAHQTSDVQVLLALVSDSAVMCGDGGIRAWDLARMGFLCRIGLLNGWITSEENLWLHSRLAVRARYYYTSWQRYNAGFIIGRLYWQSLSTSEADARRYAFSIDAGGTTNIELMRQLYTHPESPISQLPWYIAMNEIDKPASLPEMDL
ncbi:DUF1266 domain-containing protein [Rahnella inusitata]|uniref:DUF1266 domain-containing protein n=1 Tax=Rahnella inusitata TaxID=58169 RepID=UPI0039AF99A4